MIIFYIIIFVLLITTGIATYNYITGPVLKASTPINIENDLVSVLIPARNEENNITKCLTGVIKQGYENIEVIVLNDESEDNTYVNASAEAVRDNRIRIVQGNPLPDNFTGKNWACHQLSLLASGRYLLFVDADVELEKGSIASAVNEMKENNLHLLSVFPSQKLLSPGEWLLVPLMNWLLLTFLPLKLIYSSKSPSFAAANGQFMLFEQEVYKKAGGHKAVSKSITEDMEFAKQLKTKKYLVKTYLGGRLIYCRMYNNFIDSFKGFSKNFYPGFKINPALFVVLMIFLVFCYNAPLFLIFTGYIFIPAVIFIYLQRILISKISQQNPVINVILHPFQMIMIFFLGFNSLILSRKQKRVWKGRTF